MDLIVILTLLVLFQCIGHLPAGVVALVPTGAGSAWLDGPRWWFQNPLPWIPSLTGSRPLILDTADGQLAARGSAGHPIFGGLRNDGALVAPQAIESSEARGSVVHVNGAPFARCPSEASAYELASRLASEHVIESIAEATRASCSLVDLNTRYAELVRALRPLAIGGAVYAAILLGLLPGSMAWFGTEAALFRLWPAVAASHLICLSLLVLAVRRIGLTEGRLELVLPSLLYPPALLRARSDLLRLQLSSFHPAALAVQTLGTEGAREFLRRELAGYRYAHKDEELKRIATAELAGLRDLLAACELSETDVLAPPPPSHPGATRYCPLCLDEFTAQGTTCRSCNVELLEFTAPG